MQIVPRTDATSIQIEPIRAQVDAMRAELRELSHAIHDDPELQFVEYRAAARLRDIFGAAEFEVTHPLGGMPTAFRADYVLGDGSGPTVAVFCEYDALQGMGHACGHNIIAAAGAGAAIATARALRGAGVSGRVVAFGSPAEEGGGGKVKLVNAGALIGIDAAIMVHPSGFDAADAPSLGRMSLEVEFTGRAAHAAAAPELGVNALDAVTLFLTAVGLLRQQLRSDARVHAIVLEGGTSVNVIPELARVKVFGRSPDLDYLNARLIPALENCARGAAIATGCSYGFAEVAPAYEPVMANPVLEELALQVFASVGRTGAPSVAGAASTDMGNVSRVVPSLHSYVCLERDAALHTSHFEVLAGSPEGDRAVVDGATILGGVLAALLCDPALVEQAHAHFASTSRRQREKW
jgi:amidohydrolase